MSPDRVQAKETSVRQPWRQGPRPLPLHLATALTIWTGSRLALPQWSSGSTNWKDCLAQREARLRRDLEDVDLEAFRSAVDRQILGRLDQLAAGILRYRRHSHRRTVTEPPVAACDGNTRLLDYGSGQGRPGGSRPLLVIPSLINRSYILDLSENRSLMRWLAARGFDPFLVDWGQPGLEERDFSLSDYVAGRLERLLDAVLARGGGPPILIGYCMGGLLAMALALRRPQAIAGLALLATPWDFHAEDAHDGRRMAALAPALEPILSRLGMLPVDLIQALFVGRDPLDSVQKFRAFARVDPESDRAKAFVDLEDWLNDGVPLAAPVARECLFDWYGKNQPARGLWRVADQLVAPRNLAVPSLCVIPCDDRIVPPSSATALADALGHADRLSPAVGHIGMIASRKAKESVWQPLAAWLENSAAS